METALNTRKPPRRSSPGASKVAKGEAGPVHNYVAEMLRDRILSGTYADKGVLPPEMELLEEFGVSRHTIRAALQRLVLDGLIERFRGRGTQILLRSDARGPWEIRWLQDLHKEFRASDVLFAGAVPAHQYPEAAKQFSVGPRTKLFKLVRLLRAEAGAYSHSTILARAEHASKVPREDLGTQSFVASLERHAGLLVARATQLTSAELPSEAIVEALEVEPLQPLLNIKRMFFTPLGELVAMSEQHCRPDRYKHSIQILREDFSR